MGSRRGTSLLLVMLAALALVLAGCSGGPQPADDAEQGQTTDPQPAQTSDQDQDDAQGKAPSDRSTETDTAASDADASSEDASDEATDQAQTGEDDGTTTGDTTDADATTPPADQPLSVSRVEAFPQSGYLLRGGSATYNLTLQANDAGPVDTTVALTLNGKVVASRDVSLEAGAATTIQLSTEVLDEPGEHTVEVLDWSGALEVVEAAVEGMAAEGQVIADAYGLSATGVPGGKVVVTVLGEGPKSFNPVIAAETSSTDVLNLMHSNLVDVNPKTAEVMPELAKSWMVSEDGTTITFKLRRGLTWSDGEPFTVEDVLFTYQDAINNPDVNSNSYDGCVVDGEFVQMEAPDEHTLVVTAKQPFRPLLRNCMSTPIVPKHKLADKLAKLNPGVSGDISGIRSIVNNNEDALRSADEDRLTALNAALKDLESAVLAKSMDEVTTAVEDVRAQLTAFVDALDEGNLKSTLQDNAMDYADRALTHAEAGQWEGIAPGNFNGVWTTNTDPKELVGLGAYVLEDYQVDQQVLLKPNPNYWRVDPNGVPLPYLNELSILVVQDQETQFLYFKSDQADMHGARPEDWAEIFNDAEANGWKAIRGGPVYGTTWVALNQDVTQYRPNDPKYKAIQLAFRTKAFRQALSYAIDRQAMIDNIYRGLGEPQWTDISKPSPFHSPEAAMTYPFDPERAQGMLDELQLTDVDDDGTRNVADAFLTAEGACEDADSCEAAFGAEADRELAFELTTNQGNSVRESMSQQIEHDWNAVGLNVTYRPQQFNALVQNLFGSQFAAMMLGLTGSVDPASGLNVWRTDGNLHFWRFSSADNPPTWEQRIEELMNEGTRVFNVEAAVADYYREFERLVSEYLPLIYLANQQFLMAVDACMGNTDGFQAQPGNTPNWSAYGDMLWWQRGDGCEAKLESKGRLSGDQARLAR